MEVRLVQSSFIYCLTIAHCICPLHLYNRLSYEIVWMKDTLFLARSCKVHLDFKICFLSLLMINCDVLFTVLRNCKKNFILPVPEGVELSHVIQLLAVPHYPYLVVGCDDRSIMVIWYI